MILYSRGSVIFTVTFSVGASGAAQPFSDEQEPCDAAAFKVAPPVNVAAAACTKSTTDPSESVMRGRNIFSSHILCSDFHCESHV